MKCDLYESIKRPLVLHQTPILQMQIAFMEFVDKVILVRRQYNGGSKFIQFIEQMEKFEGRFFVDIARRLVGEQKPRLGNHGARNRHALLLAARKLRRIRIHSLAHADPFQKLLRVAFDIHFIHVRQAQRQGGIFPRRQMGNKPEILKNDAQFAAHFGAFFARKAGKGFPEKSDLPRAGRFLLIDKAHKGGFSRAACAREETKLPIVHHKGYMVQNIAFWRKRQAYVFEGKQHIVPLII